MTLEADFRALEDDRDQESLERPGRVILEDDTGPMSLPVQVRTRGRFRLNPYICAFPPLRLRFPTDSLHGTVLHGVEKVKVVTHCRDNNRYEQYVLEEYLSYRIYGILTEIGFRVQLALITYRDRSGDEEDISRLAFLIEDEDAVAERLSGVIVEAQQANPNQFDPWQAGLMYLFQYLIGNTDWSIARFHNVEGIRIGDRHFPLPYDFDFSGFVNASYAGPAPVVARYIKNVRERYYWGVCSEDIDYRALFSYFNQKRESILDLIERQPGLTGRNRTLATMYVESFFEVLNDDREAEYKIVYGCREMGGKGANQGIP
ncbi:MAG: hypothetical protein HKO65_19685 [Gemmatimonadetes bacterium]|nr:hypothetical protein [Gemmatimonadota bacterium]